MKALTIADKVMTKAVSGRHTEQCSVCLPHFSCAADATDTRDVRYYQIGKLAAVGVEPTTLGL